MNVIVSHIMLVRPLNDHASLVSLNDYEISREVKRNFQCQLMYRFKNRVLCQLLIFNNFNIDNLCKYLQYECFVLKTELREEITKF